MNADKDKILITGATGNVGRHVVAQLLRAGARVRALTRNPDSTGLAGDVEPIDDIDEFLYGPVGHD